MADNGDQMDVSGGEDTENDYFREVTTLDDNLDKSIDSLQGSFTLPTFTFGQSTGLQGSQGFQFLGVRSLGGETENEATNLLLRGRNELLTEQSVQVNSQTVFVPSQGTSGNISGFQAFNSSIHVPNLTSMDGSVQANFNTLLLQGSNFNPVNAGNSFRTTPREILPNTAAQDVSIKQEGGQHRSNTGSQGDSGEGASSDEKSDKAKSSPQRRGRKSRSVSSTGNETVVKNEGSQVICPKLEPSDPPGDTGFTPSLEEILTEKKLALMRSPEVIAFLKRQQQLLVQEKKHNQSHDMDS